MPRVLSGTAALLHLRVIVRIDNPADEVDAGVLHCVCCSHVANITRSTIICKLNLANWLSCLFAALRKQRMRAHDAAAASTAHRRRPSDTPASPRIVSVNRETCGSAPIYKDASAAPRQASRPGHACGSAAASGRFPAVRHNRNITSRSLPAINRRGGTPPGTPPKTTGLAERLVPYRLSFSGDRVFCTGPALKLETTCVGYRVKRLRFFRLGVSGVIHRAVAVDEADGDAAVVGRGIGLIEGDEEAFEHGEVV